MLSIGIKNDLEEIEFVLRNTFSELNNRYESVFKKSQLTIIKSCKLLHRKHPQFLDEISVVHNCSPNLIIYL